MKFGPDIDIVNGIALCRDVMRECTSRDVTRERKTYSVASRDKNLRMCERLLTWDLTDLAMCDILFVKCQFF